MFLDNLLLTVIGLAGGFSVAGGIFALITSIGLIPRIAMKSKTISYVKTYETAIISGGLLGNIFTTMPLPQLHLPPFFLIPFGLFSGIFVGCLAVSLAEALNVTAVFTRRLRLHKGIAFIVLSMAAGKIAGSLFYFFNAH